MRWFKPTVASGWLQAAEGHERYDLIFLDPPTFSNSKRMEGVLDLQRDHPALIELRASLLAPGGLLVFSTNAQKFKLDESITERYDVEDYRRQHCRTISSAIRASTAVRFPRPLITPWATALWFPSLLPP